MRHETLFDAGKLIVVEANIVGPRGTTTARMLLDTGATMTTVSPELLGLVGYSPRDGARRTSVHSRSPTTSSTRSAPPKGASS